MSETNINLKTIDWNNLSVEEFAGLSETLGDNTIKNKRLPNDKKFIVIEIDNITYEISSADYTRFKTLKSKKSKENFEIYVKKNYQPIIEL